MRETKLFRNIAGLKKSIFRLLAILCILQVALSSCNDEKITDNKEDGRNKRNITLNLFVPPILQTKAEVRPATAGSEAEKAGFHYEMVVTGNDTTGMELPETKAPASLTNLIAILFNADGTFKEKISLNTVTSGTPCTVSFTATGTSYQLVIVGNNPAGANNLSQLSSFTGTYAAFKTLEFTGTVTKDEDIPYIGYTTIDIDKNDNITLPMYRMMAKVTLINNTFSIANGPTRTGISLVNAGKAYFGTSNNYDGTGTVIPTACYNTTAVNTNTATWFVGENVQSSYTATVITDRNRDKAPKAAYVQITSASQNMTNTNPDIGEESFISDVSFTFDIFLGSGAINDFSLRRHNNYTITVSVNSTLTGQYAQASIDKRVRVTEANRISTGLCIGCFGGASGYTTGSGDAPSIAGNYTKYLLLQPNTSGTTKDDNVSKKWSDKTTQLQTETRKYWDHTYTVSRMDQTTDLAYDYCYNLTLGGVAKGTWYLPTQSQVILMWTILKGLKNNVSFANYRSFGYSNYWCSTEFSAYDAWSSYLGSGYMGYGSKTPSSKVRCVKDSPGTTTVSSNATIKNGFPVIDLSGLSPLGCIFSSSEAATRRIDMNNQAPSNTTLLGVGLSTSGDGGTWNAKMSTTFQVMRADHTVGSTTWANAYLQCKQYSGEGGTAGQWRLPTQRELLMIWILHPQLIGKGNFTAFSTNYYWSATEFSEDSVWFLLFTNGNISFINKANTYRVRCVKDL